MNDEEFAASDSLSLSLALIVHCSKRAEMDEKKYLLKVEFLYMYYYTRLLEHRQSGLDAIREEEKRNE